MKKNRSFFLLVLLSCLLLIGLLAAPYAYQRAKRWQAQRFFDDARQSESVGDILGAISKAEASHRLQPDNDAALMYLARLSLLLPEGHEQMNRWWEEAMRTPDCTPADILLYVEKLVANGDLSRAYPLIVSLRELQPDNERVVNLQSRILIDERKLVEAERLLREFLSNHRDAGAVTHQRLAETLLSFASTARRKEAEAILLDLAKHATGEPQLFALRRITRSTELFSPKERADAGEILLQRDDLTIADRLTAYNSLLEDRRMRRTEIRDRLIALLQEESEDENDALARLGAWLINSDQSRYFLQLLTLDEARLDPNIFAARLMAMVRVGDAEEVYGITFDRSDENPLDEVQNLLIRAEALAALERRDEFLTTLRSLADLANADNFKVIERRLLSYGAWDILLEAYDRLLSIDSLRPMARRKKLIAYYFLGRERDLLTLLEEFDGYLTEEEPTTQALIAYLNTLYGREAEESTAIAESLVTRYPNIIDFRVVLAFNAYKRGQIDRVDALVGDLPMIPENRERYLQIAMAVLRASLGKPTDYQQISTGLLEEDLLPAERVLLRGIGET